MNHKSDEQGSFLNGFTLGLLAGAAGYFLFGTKRGEQLKDRLSQEWQQAREAALKENLQPGEIVEFRTLRELFKHLIGKIKPGQAPTPAKKNKLK